MNDVTLGIHRLHADVLPPTYGTSEAACFDIRAYITDGMTIKKYDCDEFVDYAIPILADSEYHIRIMPTERVLVPTGIVFDIPVGYSMRIHSRSGLAFNKGLVLANGEGVIDSDYHHETFVMVVNIGNDAVLIKNGDRIAQAEVVPVITTQFIDATHPSEKRKVSRKGGFGSTGV